MSGVESLESAGHAAPRMPMGEACAAHTHHEWVPLERHHVWPVGMGGPNVADNIITVCCNAHYACHEYIRQLMLHNGEVPWEIVRHFGPKIRRFAIRGWTEAGKPVHGSSAE